MTKIMRKIKLLAVNELEATYGTSFQARRDFRFIRKTLTDEKSATHFLEWSSILNQNRKRSECSSSNNIKLTGFIFRISLKPIRYTSNI